MAKQTSKKKQYEFKISGEDVVQKVKKLIEQGNVRKVTVKGPKGQTLFEIPVTAAVVGSLLMPVLAAVGVATALISKCTILVEKK